MSPENKALEEAAETLLVEYRLRYAKPSTDGVRANAPLQREMGELKIALDAARAQGPAGSGETEIPDLEAYDAGLLSDYGGGNIGWWQDYIRAELATAHDFYQAQMIALWPLHHHDQGGETSNTGGRT